MTVLVTGAAGFIGSHLCQRLLQKNIHVIGIDCFSDFYPKWVKEQNIEPLLKDKNFKFIPEDLMELPLKQLLQNTDYIFHLAAQAGVRTSWGQNFSVYIKNNIQATQKILETAKEIPLKKIIYASSSSVYGLTPDLPMTETSPLYPLSPYGVTKLAAEQLCFLYFKNYGVPTVSLRFFTVYGPGQRPDMAFHKFFKALREAKEITVYGDGKQTRDFTYIDDIVNAALLSLEKSKIGEVYNIGGGHRERLEDLFPLLEDISQQRAQIRWVEKQKGDVLHTLADINKAQKELGYSPHISLQQGLKEEWLWIQKLYRQ
ncbi:MAG: NAD-dependent epimerase/dehydratase family protein [Candidatus Aminicenantales bacterium]